MRRIEIHGTSTALAPKGVRTATRAIIENDSAILFSYLEKRNQYLIPGGGMEGTETPRENVIRELKEECGLKIEPQEPFLVVDELYGDFIWRNYYCVSTAVGRANANMDAKEKELGLRPVWLEKGKAIGTLLQNKADAIDLELEGSPLSKILATLNSQYREALALSILFDEAIPPVPQWLLGKTISKVGYSPD